MQVGDLVKFRDNDAVGLVVYKSPNPCKDGLFRIQWLDGSAGVRFGDELEVISASR